MGLQSTAIILYDASNNPLAVQNGVATPASTPVIMAGGSDGATTRYLLTDASGRQVAVGAAASAAAVAGNPVRVAGSDGATTRDVLTDTSGRQIAVGAAASGAAAAGNPVLVAGLDTATARSMIVDASGRPIVVGPGVAGTPAGGVVSTQVPNTAGAAGTLNAANATATVALAGTGGAGMQLAAGTLIGTIVPEVSYDAGTTWVAAQFVDPITLSTFASIVFTAANTAQARTIQVGAGVTDARVRVSAFTSGTASCTLRATSDSRPLIQPVQLVLGAKQTYSASSGAFTPPATPTDMFTLTGSATKVIRVLRMILSWTATGATTSTFFLVKRSTANTAGTSAAATAVPYDSQDAAATATALVYSANPTLGTTVGNVQALKVFGGTTGGTTQVPYEFDFKEKGLSQGLVLRGTAQVLALNFGGVALPAGMSVTAVFVWTEE